MGKIFMGGATEAAALYIQGGSLAKKRSRQADTGTDSDKQQGLQGSSGKSQEN